MKKLLLSLTIILAANFAYSQNLKPLKTETDGIIDSINIFLRAIPKETVIKDGNTGSIIYTTLLKQGRDSLKVGFYHSEENRLPLTCDPSNLRQSTEYIFTPSTVYTIEKGNTVTDDNSIIALYLIFSANSVLKVESEWKKRGDAFIYSKCESMVDRVPLYYRLSDDDERNKLAHLVSRLLKLYTKK